MRLIFFLCLCLSVFVWTINSQSHNVFYGSCGFNNASETIYSEVVSLRNNNTAQANKKENRRWFPRFSFFLPWRHNSSKKNVPPINSGQNLINATFYFPPFVSTQNREIVNS